MQPCYKNLVACDTHSRSKVTHHDFPTNLKTKVVFIFILISSLNILYPLHLPLYKLIIQISIAKNINSIIRKKCRDAKETHYTHLDTVLWTSSVLVQLKRQFSFHDCFWIHRWKRGEKRRARVIFTSNYWLRGDSLGWGPLRSTLMGSPLEPLGGTRS